MKYNKKNEEQLTVHHTASLVLYRVFFGFDITENSKMKKYCACKENKYEEKTLTKIHMNKI